MADKVQRVIYRIVVDTAGMAAGVAEAKAKIAALREDDSRATRAATDNAGKEAGARREVARAQREVNRATEDGRRLSTAFIRHFRSQVSALHAAQRAADRETDRLHSSALRENVARDKARTAAVERTHVEALRENTVRQRAAAAAAGRIHAEALRENLARERAAAAVIGRVHAEALQEEKARRTAAAREAARERAALHAQAIRENREFDRQRAIEQRRVEVERRAAEIDAHVENDRLIAEARRRADEADRRATIDRRIRERERDRQWAGAEQGDLLTELAARPRPRPRGLGHYTREPEADQAQLNRMTQALRQLEVAQERANRQSQRTVFLNREEARTRSETVRHLQHYAQARRDADSVDLDMELQGARAEAQRRTDEDRAAERRRTATHTQSRIDRDRDRDMGDPSHSRGRRFARGAQDFARTSAAIVGSVASDISDAGGQKMRYWQILIAAVLTAIIALIPLIASLTAVMGAFLSAATAAFGAVGIFALAAIGHVKQLVEALKAAKETGAPLPKQFEEVGAAFERLRAAYATFQAATRGPVFEVFIDALELASGLLPRFVPLVQAAGRGIQGALDVIDQATSGDRFGVFLSFLQREGPDATVSFTRSLKDLAAGVAELAMSFGPYIEWFLQGFEDMSKGFKEWARGLSTSNTFRDFMAYAQEQGPVVLDTLKALVGLLINLGVALAPTGEFLMLIIRLLARLADAIPSEVLKAFTIILTGWIALRAVVFVITGIVAAVKALGAVLLAVRIYMVIASSSLIYFGVAAGVARAAVLALATTLAIVAAAAVAYLALSSASDKAAESSRRQTEAAHDLAQELTNNEGVASEGYRQQKLHTFATKKLERPGFFGYGTKYGTFQKESTTVLDEAKIAGIDTGSLIDGALGDDKQRNKVIAQWEAFIKEREAAKKAAEEKYGRDSKEAKGVGGQIQEQKRALDEYRTTTSTSGQLATAKRDMADAAGGAADAFDREAKAAEALEEKIKTLTTATEAETRMQAAIDALTVKRDADEALSDAQTRLSRLREDVPLANARALRAVTDAERNMAESQRRSREAQEAVTKARQRAIDNLEDMRKKLRDVALNEEGASISLARAEQNVRRVMNAPGSTDLDRRQALLDLQRSRYEYTDTFDESKRTRRDAAETERKGVEGSDEVQQAKRDATDASLAAKDAEQDWRDAIRQRDRTLQDGQETLADAEREVGDLALKAEQAAANLDKIAAAAGVVPGQLQGIIDKKRDLDAAMEKELSTKSLSDFEGRLKTILLYMDAWRIMADNPSLTVDQALAQAYAKTEEGQIDARGYRKVKGGRQFAGEGIATGGPVNGPGTGTSDDVPAWLSAGEHVWTAAETAAVGGHKVLEGIRDAVVSGRFTRDDALAFVAGAAKPFANTAKMRLHAHMPGFAAGGAASRFDPTGLYAGLDLNARRVSLPGRVPTLAAAPSTTVNNTSHGGVSLGSVVINNPVREPAGDSLYRSVRKLAFEYQGG